MPSDWFYRIDGVKHGPVSSKELADLARSGTLAPSTQVWKEGMAEWQPAGKLKGLFPTVVTPPHQPGSPPSLPTTGRRDRTRLAANAQQTQDELPQASAPSPRRGLNKKAVLIGGAVVAVSIAAVAVVALVGKGTRGPSAGSERLDGGDDLAAIVAAADRQARTEMGSLLPTVGELHEEVKRFQRSVAQLRKDTERVDRAVLALNRSTIDSGHHAGKQVNFFALQAEYGRLAMAYELDPNQIDAALEAVDQRNRDPVMELIDSRKKLESAVKSLLANKEGPASKDIHVEQLRQDLAKLRNQGPQQVKQPTPDDLANLKARREKAYQELNGNAFELERLKKMHADEDRLEAATRAADQERYVRDHDARIKSLEQSIAKAEAEARGKTNAANTELVARAQDVLDLLASPSTAQLEQSWNRIRQRFGQLTQAIKEMRDRVERRRPTVSRELLSELEVVSGITHMIDGELYYLDNKIVHIPAKYAPVYVHDRVNANTAAISNHFRFKGNKTGKNKLGAMIPVAMYECDDRHAEVLLKERDFGNQAGPYLVLFRPINNKPLESIYRTVRNLVGDDQYGAVISAAEARAAADIERPGVVPKPTEGNVGSTTLPTRPIGPDVREGPKSMTPSPAPLPVPKVPDVPKPKDVVPVSPKFIKVYKVVFPGDVLLTTNEQEVNNIIKVYPGEFKGDRGHWTGTFGYAYAEPQDGAVLLRRYLIANNKRVFSTRKIDSTQHKEEGMGAWVYENERPGTTLRLGLLRQKDSAREYTPESLINFFGDLGYKPTELKFYMFDKPELP